MSSAKVQFHWLDHSFSLRDRNRLKLFIESLFRREKKSLESLNYIFCSDKYLLNINRQFLQHDFYTDIISFDLSTGPATIGDIYISIDRVRDNAAQLGIPLSVEVHRVIFHGALHLCGYKDKSKPDQAKMRQKEDQALSLYFRK
jgi:probable rRNA maturation factor